MIQHKTLFKIEEQHLMKRRKTRKDISKGGTISCIYCESLTHKSCTDNSLLETSKYRCETCLINNVNTIQSEDNPENNAVLKVI